MSALKLDVLASQGAASDAASSGIDVWAPKDLQVACDPSEIEVGITCGMSDMCGESPCLCGAQDAWQDCACNGLETLHPEITVNSSDPAVAQALQLGGSWHVVGLMPGEADIIVHASLKHYDDAQQTVHVTNGAPGLVPIAGALLLVAIIAAIAALLSRRRRKRKAGGPDGPSDGPAGQQPKSPEQTSTAENAVAENPTAGSPAGVTAKPSLLSTLQRHRAMSMTALVIALVAVLVLSLGLGRYDITPSLLLDELGRIIANGADASGGSTPLSVFVTMRLPRIAAALLVGAGLAGAGAAFQGIFKNPMVSPDLLGASAGAGFGAALAILAGLGAVGLEISAFAFGILAVFCTYTLAKVIGRSMSGVLTLILSGMVMANLFQAFISAAKYMADPNSTLPEITFWLMGGLSRVTAYDLPWLAAAFAIGCIGLTALRWRINVLAMGDEEAMSLGVDVERSRKLTIAFATLLTSASTAIAGMVGWVGLIIPHLARAVVGSDHRFMLPASMLLGGTFLLLVDDLCRSIYTTEIPLSILTSIIGVPLFIYLIARMKGVDRA